MITRYPVGMKSRLILGTRGSLLARTQSQWVADRLQEVYPGLTVELKIIRTAGDVDQVKSLPEIGGKGLFTQELDEGLLAGEIDIAVHSMKDLPTEVTAGIAVLAVPARETTADALISREGQKFRELPKGSRIGTGSLRRLAQLRYQRPELEFHDIRGNVDTRLRKLDSSQYEAIILAGAGLRRLGLEERVTEYLDQYDILPAVGQGALAVAGRCHDVEVQSLLTKINDPATCQAVCAERAMLAALGGGCHVPIAAHGVVVEGRLRLRGLVAAPDGLRIIRAEECGALDAAVEIGEALARELLNQGARELLNFGSP
ncbi:MAG: Porphobilinogen deaminase [Phycisphaerae bacterium]|nr:Porphobilinogen deaminase [Phycisphaerae bacterium]